MIGPFDWLFGATAIPATSDFQAIEARYESLSKSLPRYFK